MAACAYILRYYDFRSAKIFTDPIRDRRDGKGQAPVANYVLPDDTLRTRRVPNFGVGEKLPWPTTGQSLIARWSSPQPF